MVSRSTPARVVFRACLLGVAASLLADSSAARADGISGGWSIFNNGSDPGVRASVHHSYSTPFSGGASGPLSSVQAGVSYGAASVTADLAIADYSYTNQQYASAGGGGQWSTTVTINNPALTGQQGVLHTAFHVTGSFSVDQIPLPWGQAEGYIYVDGNVVAQVGYDWYNPSAYDPDVAHYATIPYDRAFTYGVPFDMGAGANVSVLESNYGGKYNASTFHGALSIRGGGFTVTDSGGVNPVGFSSVSLAGAGAGANVPTGSPYAGFSVDNSGPAAIGHGTVMTLLDGSASADTSIAGTFIAADPTGASLLHSDVVDFHGTNHDKFVLQLTYDPANVADESSLVIGWHDPVTGRWTNAVNGNSDGGAHQMRIPGPYVAPADFVLGDYGVDTANHVVWAVVDHNSEFAAVLQMLGDTNYDGVLDQIDAHVILANLGQAVAGGYSAGDFNGDGRVNADDLALFDRALAQHGTSLQAVLGQVPEPGSCTAGLMAAASGVVVRRRRK